MIYRSNILIPDLQPHFRHAVSRVMGHSFGHDVLSDWSDKPDDDPAFGLYKQCGFWTHDEAAILYAIAEQRPGLWLDIGAHTGWTAAHVIAAGGHVVAVDPMLRLQEWQQRIEENLNAWWNGVIGMSYLMAADYCNDCSLRFDGIIIDGDHNAPKPRIDAINADRLRTSNGVILLHDAMGGPVWDAIYWLIGFGYRCHMYMTPHMVACCWVPGLFPEWKPPMHVPDPAIDWREIQTNHMKAFDWNLVTHDEYAKP